MTESPSQPGTDLPEFAGDYRPSPPAEVERVRQAGRWVLVFTRELDHPVNRVWEAITEPGQLRQWAPYTADRDLATTGDAVLTMLDGDQPVAEVTGTVLRSDPPRLLVHAWGGDVLRWELVSTEDGTTLTLRQTYDDERLTSSLAAGWHLCLDAADALMKDVPFGPVAGSAALRYGWAELNEQYATVLGVPPSAPHPDQPAE